MEKLFFEFKKDTMNKIDYEFVFKFFISRLKIIFRFLKLLLLNILVKF